MRRSRWVDTPTWAVVCTHSDSTTTLGWSSTRLRGKQDEWGGAFIDPDCSHRIHQNFLEVLPIIVILILIAGLHFPITAAVLGYVQAFSRLLSISYLSKKGATHFLRIASSVISGVSVLGAFVLASIVTIRFIQGHAA